jgi:hypothetical protein
VWLEEYTEYVDVDTGEPVSEHDIDCDTEDDPSRKRVGATPTR